jgi:hypothetical protein
VERGDHQRLVPRVRGGSFHTSSNYLAASYRGVNPWSFKSPDVGFRFAMIPEPGTGLLVIAGLLGVAGWRRARD